MFIEKGKEMWDVGDGKGKLTTGRFLRRFCGLELFVEGGGVLWLCLPFCIRGGGGSGGEEEDGEKGRLCIGGGYTVLVEGMVQRFRFAVGTLGMEGVGNVGERRLEHWRVSGDWDPAPVNGDFGVKLMLFSAGFVVA